MGDVTFAIVGIGCRLPGGATSREAFWELMAEGRDAITEVPADRPEWRDLYDPDPAAPGRIYARYGGFVEGIDQFDPRFFGISPREATRMDPQQRMLLEVVWHAFEDARIDLGALAGSGTGVFVGISTHDYADVQMYPQHRGDIDAHSNTGGATSIAANRISYTFDLRGPSFTVDSACSSALTAVHLACRSLAAGDCDVAIAAGVQLLLRPELTMGFCRASMLSLDGRCKAFDASGNGYVRSEGAGAIVLKPLERALADGDPVHAVILGTAINQDGHTSGLTVPSEESQSAMLRSALRSAGVAPSAVQYVEAHGTGTAVGDPIEARAIGSVFAEGRAGDQPLLLGSVKTNIGHLEAAAGIAGLIKTALALRHRQIPASLHFSEWNPAIDAGALQLAMATQLQPWPETTSPVAAVSSFGFGGANASAVLGAPPAAGSAAEPQVGPRAELLALSARSPEALRALALQHVERLLDDTGPLASTCAAAARGRAHGEHRLAVVGDTRDAVASALESVVSGERGPVMAGGRASTGRAQRLAFVYSGMGPQWWAMGRELLDAEPAFAHMMARCDEALRPVSGWSLVSEFRAAEDSSRIAHPLLAQVTNFALQVSLTALWREWGVVPEAVLGHSGGAMAAAHEAGIYGLEDAILLSYHRSRLQGRDANAGGMLAVGLPVSEAPELIAGVEDRISVAAVNAPASMTLSGDPELLADLAERLTARQVFARMLPVTIAYHSPRMDPIREEFEAAAAELRGRAGSIPFVSDTTGTWQAGEDLDAAYWWRAIRQPVRFADSVATLLDAGITGIVEIAPHPVLASSIQECMAAHGTSGLVVASLRRQAGERTEMLRSLAALYAEGADVAWAGLYPRREVGVDLPLYPFQRERHWFEPSDAADDVGVGAPDGNPLLGRRLPTAQPIWEARLGDGRLDYLDDHVVAGAVVFPGAGYIAAGLAAARRLADPGGGDEHRPVALSDLAFLRPLILDDRAGARLQVVVAADRFSIHAGTDADRAAWPAYATGRIATAVLEGTEPPPPLDLAALRSRLPEAHDPAAFYEALRGRGLDYGERFAGVTELRVGDREALARVGPVTGVGADRDAIHPALLDAAFQALVAVAAGARPQDDRLFLPTSVDEVRLHRPAGAALWVRCRLERTATSSVVGSFDLLDDDGAVLLEVRGLRAQLVDTADGEGLDRWLYSYRWEPAPLALDGPTRRPRSLVDVTDLDRAQAAIPSLQAETGWPRYYTEAEAALSELAAAQVLTALEALGLPATPGALLTAAEVEDLSAREPSGGRWVRRLLGLLEETGCAERQDVPATGWRILRTADADGAAARLQGYETDVALLREAGRTLPAALAGEAGTRDAVMTPDTLALLERFYRDAPASAFYNRVLAEAVSRLVPERRAGALRILEIGAGTGGASGAVLGALPETDIRYLLTDSAPALLDATRARLAGDPRVRCQVLDVSAGLEGLQPVDLVIAANVVHATPDVAATLGALRRLLLPGGALVLLEITRHPRWLDVVFGQTQGWWAATDTHLRPEHPLLEAAAWRAQLAGAGFGAVWTSAEPGAPGEAAQTVIVASAGAPVATAVGPWVLIGPASATADGIVAGLEALGHEVRRADEPTGALLDGLLAAPVPPAGILRLWSPGEAHRDPAAALSGPAGEALDLVQAVLARPELRCPLWLVTTGAMRLADDPHGLDAGRLGGAGVWGLGRTTIKEHPELALRLVDLGVEPSTREVAALLRQVTESDPDEELALRGDTRLVRRLRRDDPGALPSRRPLAGAEGGWRAEVGTRGSLASLRLRAMRPTPPAADEVRIDIEAASLNFRDVMLAMGGIPGLEDELSFGHGHLGSDCAGLVTAIGDGVAHLRVGDAVMGMAPGSLGSAATTAGALVVPRPPGMTAVEAASTPTVFLTAWYALVRLARVRAGERVLIHSATGGVGLAAIQIAHHLGAEVFATAGSEAKRAHLRDLGIAHVMDSRTLAFGEQVLAATGGEGVDVVLNSLTGEAIERGIACLRPYGRFLEIGKLDIYTDQPLRLGRFRRNLSYFAIDLDRLCAEQPDVVGELLREVAEAFTAGHLTPPPRHDFAMADMEDAFRLMAKAGHLGKIVLSRAPGEVPPLPMVSGLEQFVRPDGSYLVTGGLGGFGLEVAEHLAAARPGALVLMGRRPPAGAASERLDALRATGARVEFAQGDVSRREDVDAVLARIARELPPLRGVFHGAMVLDDRPLAEIDAASLDTVLAPKAVGAWHLHEATADLALDHFVLFSSIASLLGNPLQASYGAASAMLDELAQHRRATEQPALAINWGVLAGSGYVAERPELRRFLEHQGYLAFTLPQALTALDALLGSDVPQAMVARVDWRRLAAALPVAAASPRIRDLVPQGEVDVAAPPTEILGRLAAADPEARAEIAEEFLAGALGRILGLAAAEVERDRPFEAIGVDSLMAVELTAVLSAEMGVELPVMGLLAGMTVQRLAAIVLEQLGDLAVPSALAAPAAPPAAELPSPAAAGDQAAAPPVAATAPVAEASPSEPAAAPAANGTAATPRDYRTIDYARWSPLQRVARGVSRAGFGALGTVDAEGLERLPASGPVILAVNHLSMADVPLALTLLPRRTIILATDELRRFTSLEWLVGRVGQAIWVPRDGDPGSALAKALDVLEAGGVLALAPEARRNRGGLGAAQSGVAWLSQRAGAPVIPYAAWGQERWRGDLRRLRRLDITVRLGDPLPPPPADADDLALRAFTQTVMVALARMLPPAYRGAYADLADTDHPVR